ncbi:F-box protein At2g39490-like isoform X2 [Glycine soja]|uniref:F-box protein At2g39490-like isoform X2 n=1 Tax=Glycine soja TaxID=3848 RepID=UPI00103B68E3|nr:F-box protein At2g39490-like isoform X2 [Glycine soja]
MEDPFSNLPDEILSCIVSFLPLETSLISTRWRDLWNQALVRHGSTQDDVASVVAGFLSRFEELDPLKHPRKLHFHFSDQDTALFASIATNKHLEKLVIVECTGLQSLFIESESKLHELTILDCPQLKSLHLRTSKLKSFRLDGPLPTIWPESHFNLSHAMLNFRLGPSCADFKAQYFNQTLLTIKNCEALTLCEWTFQELIWPSISPSGNFIFYKIRELWWIHNHRGENSMDTLVSFLKLCPALEQLFVTNDSTSYSAPRSNSYCLTQETKYSTKLEHLKRIKFMGFTNRVDEISVAKKLIELVKGEPPKIETSDESCLNVVIVQ